MENATITSLITVTSKKSEHPTDHSNIEDDHRDYHRSRPLPYDKTPVKLYILKHQACTNPRGKYLAHEQSLHKPLLNLTTRRVVNIRQLFLYVGKCAYKESARTLIPYFISFLISATGPPETPRRSIQIISVNFAFAAKLIVPNINVIRM